jgi:TonB family protein
MRRRLFFLATLFIAGAAIVPARAAAQDVPPAQPPAGQPPAGQPAQPPAPQPVVTAPVVKKNEGAAYPKQALDEGVHETVEVPVLLNIDASGVVTRAVVEKPVGHGFDEAAVAAAQKLEFEPATRDGKAVAARIRFVYKFAPPPAVLAGRVVTQAGERPVGGATIVVRDAAGAERTATTGPDGTWRVDGLPAGTYHLTVSAAGMTPHEVDQTIAPGEEASAVDRLAPEKPVPPPPIPGAPGEEIQEVEVRGTKPPREVTKRTVEQREISRIPGTNGDALRSLQNLPGVGRPPGLAGLLIVRGSAPQDTQYFIDGTPVPIIYHFGGLSSVVPTEMLDRIDFYPGNFSAQYGRAMGGIVDVGLTSPKSDKIHGLAQVDLIDARLLVQGPIADTGWRFAVAGRRSWFDYWLGPVLSAAGADVTVAPVYYDYQAMVERDIGRHSTLRLSFFGSDDQFKILLKNASQSEPDLAGTISSHTGFWRTQALYKNKLAEGTELRVVGSVGEDYVDFKLGNFFFKLDDYPITGRVEVAQKLDKRLTMNVGFDVIYAPYTATVRLPLPPKPGQPPPGPFSGQVVRDTSATDQFYEPAMYVEWEATPWRGGRVVPGVRLDYTKDTKGWDVDPRIVVRQDVTTSPRTTLKGGAGLFTQPPTPQQTNTVFGMPGLVSNRALHYDVGVERELTRNIEASVEGFYKQLDRLVVQGSGNTGSGVIYGGETLIRYKPDERFFGWLAYTLSRSLRRDAPGMPLRTSQFDETHILTVLGSYKLGNGWEFGARYRLTSGYMYTPLHYGFYDENVGSYIPLQDYPVNGSRLPLFHSLDLRVDKTIKRPWGSIAFYIDVLNVYNSGNAAGVAYDYNGTHSSFANDLPFLPSLGARVEM